MVEDTGRAPVTALWVVSLMLVIGFLLLCVVALRENVEIAALFGLAGLGIGGLLATTYHLSQSPRRAAREERSAVILDRISHLESEQDRVEELEERLEFAERLLAEERERAPRSELPLRDGPALP